MDEHQEPVQKEKKPRTEAQIAAWNKAQETRIANAKAKKDTKVTEYVEQKIDKLKKKLPPKQVIQETVSDSSDSEEEEPEVVVVRVPKKEKPKKKPKKQIRVELEEEEFSSEEDTPLVRPKVAQKPPPKAVAKQSPVQPHIYFV